ncbi:predicted protein [Nematostella vectensis]|uniref:C-factor n=1 Tax=Nematostella vectensis TaxID=45351 RepID=A7RW42_NEMVE|nr:predicted protein [Nematostella vectensis]|eukprot:XP_001636410.1 predicted protein [Nematostella vectensis]
MAPLALVQGASRGIGLQFCRHLLARGNGFVLATCRNPTNAKELQDLRSNYPKNMAIFELDAHNEEKIKATADMIKENHGSKLDLLLNCAGMLHPSGKGETSLKEVTAEALRETFSTNSIGPLLMAKHFGAMLANGDGTYGCQDGSFRGTLVNISARVGSIGDNKLGGWYSYRMSKTALNMATKTLSIELGRGRNKIVCISVHPGTVDTDLSRRYHRSVDPSKIFTPEYSVECMMKVIDGLTLADSGKFFAWDGQEIVW